MLDGRSDESRAINGDYDTMIIFKSIKFVSVVPALKGPIPGQPSDQVALKCKCEAEKNEKTDNISNSGQYYA